MKSQNSRNQDFSYYFCLMIDPDPDPDPDLYLWLTDLDPHQWCHVLSYYSGCVHRSVLGTSPVPWSVFLVSSYKLFDCAFSCDCDCDWLFRLRAEVKCSFRWPIGKREYMLIFKGKLTRWLLTDPKFFGQLPDLDEVLPLFPSPVYPKK